MKIKSFFSLLFLVPLTLFSLEDSAVDKVSSLKSKEALQPAKYAEEQYAILSQALENQQYSLRIATFNTLFDLYDHNLPVEHRWPQRVSRVVEVIREMAPDLLGVQEVYPHQRDDLLASLGDAYDFFAKPEGDGELSGIFYKKGRFEVLDAKVWYLSEEGPEVPKGRTLTMLEVKDKVSDRALAIFNVHLAFSNMEKRVIEAHNIHALIKTFKASHPETSLVMTGDFNTFPNRPDFKGFPFYDGDYTQKIIKEDLFVDAKEISLLGHIGPYATFTNKGDDPTPFQGTGTPGVFLDHIYVSPDVTVLIHAANPAKVNGLFPSDHMPLLADVLLPTEE